MVAMTRLFLFLTLWLALGVPALASGYFGSALPAPGSSGNVLTSNGSTWASAAASGLPAGVTVAVDKRAMHAMATSSVATTLTGIGMSNWTHGGTTVTNAFAADGGWVNSASAATTGSDFGLFEGTGVCTWAQPFDLTFTVKTGANAADITACRTWVGATDNSANSLFQTDTPHNLSRQCIAFRYNPGVDGTVFWRTVTSSTAATTATATTQSIAADTKYIMRIVWNPGVDAKFYINGTLVNTHTTSLPTGSGETEFCCGGETTENVAKNFKISRCYVEVP